MITEPRPLPRRSLRLARTAATVMLTLLLAVATAACSTPASPSTPAAGGDVPAHAAATRDDPRFRDTFRHECADVDGVRMRDARVVGHDLGAAVAFQYASQFPDDTAPLGYLDLRDTVAAAPVGVPTLLMAAQGQLEAIRGTVAPRVTNIVRAVDVPNAGHWLVQETPQFVTAELLRFLDG
ncbi:hypothetical protein SAMN06297387_10330 [Streptomyces zhaozhouensis]|uniref:Alpha/beta hydrolase family protein n=1 Tax=Streptomyces zhaozhouensis TaxID=1300267 RepID=A0A286DRF0_9ACTN|nr:hypothetical protein [Streptomyces zhaozhouensis]SOD61209.1 hypothetical protein SAMN06297387_10330 [Streptomyces zhaozhouensis]